MNDMVTDALENLFDLGIREEDGDYKLLNNPGGLSPCPICGSAAELWERKQDDHAHKVVACSNNGKKEVDHVCPCYWPPECFYKATKREAIEYWQRHTSKYSVANTHLSFVLLRQANDARKKEFKNAHGDHPDYTQWTRADWLEAMVGEVGEYANISKKFRRGDLLKEDFLEQAEEELADVQIYLDRLASEIGIDLGNAVVKKFNKDSVKRGCVTLLKVTPTIAKSKRSQTAHKTHILRFSDSTYDFVCTKCGATDGPEDDRLHYECPPKI